MENFFSSMIKNFREFWGSLSVGRKVGMIAVGVSIVLVFFGLVKWATDNHYKALFTELNKEDSSRIMRFLEEKKISYQTSDDGKTIRIPETQVEIARIEIAKQGMSFTGTVGYEIFDNQPFGTTSYVQKINKQRALEGELVKTISYIEGVKRARVHLSIPDSSPFVSEKKPPSASVIIDLDRGVTLATKEINGIASLVAASVDGMRSENVVILDAHGKKISENSGDGMTADAANRIGLEAKINRQLEQKVEEILARVVGDGKVIAKVTAKMDFTESVSTETTYDSENASVLSQVKNAESINGSRPSPQGIPGARSNLPSESPQPGVPETKNVVNKDLTTTNYNVPSKVTKSRHPTARMVSMSVAVMVDGKSVPILDKNGNVTLNQDGVALTKYEPWSEAQIADFQSIVSSGLGLDQKRGDSVVIKNMEFAKEDMAAAEAMMREKEKREFIKNAIKYLAIGLFIVLFFFMVVRPFIQWITENTVESIEDFLPRTIEELEKVQSNQRLPGLEDALPELDEKINPDKIEGNMLKEKLITLVESDPNKAAQVIHEMIHTVETQKEIA